MKHNLAFIKRLNKAKKNDLMVKALMERIECKANNKGVLKPIQSLSEGLHIRVSESGESWKEYGIIDGMSDSDLDELINDEWLTIYSPYDCTGKAFSCWIDTKRNKCGTICWIHCKGIDV